MLKNKGGFTLIELVMIIIILGILAAVAVPKYYDLSKDAREATLKATWGSLKSAQAIQIAKKKGTLPTVTELAGQVDGGIAAATQITVSNVFRKDGTTLYGFKTYTDEACTAATAAVGNLVSCIKCEFNASGIDCTQE